MKFTSYAIYGFVIETIIENVLFLNEIEVSTNFLNAITSRVIIVFLLDSGQQI
jgi:hypothetical protein